MALGGAVIIALVSFVAFTLAYFLYGEFISRRLFGLRKDATMPSEEFEDGVDFVPTRRHILMGHHFTSIAGAAPIVGPAIAVIWGWLPALLWVVLGGIFMGAVHDLGSLVLSVRNKGRSIGDLAGDILGRPGWLLFLGVIFFLLLVVIAVFAWIIAGLFVAYPSSLIPIWLEIPLAIWLGRMIYTRKRGVGRSSLIAVVIMFVTIWIGARVPISLGAQQTDPATGQSVWIAMEVAGTQVSAQTVWLLALFVYAFIASQLPVHRLLQPRDYINAHELYIGMGLLFVGLAVARPEMAAPAIRAEAVPGAPPLIPMLFVIVACGAISGFHSLVSSGTSSKQLRRETDAKAVGYGSMLLESMLAVLAILACCAGLGMGLHLPDGTVLTGRAAWDHHYATWGSASPLMMKIGAFVTGGGHFLESLHLPLDFSMTLMAVIIVSFAATTLDTATRIQRYVVSEIALGLRLRFLRTRTVATSIAVVTAGALALYRGGGQGGLILWPVFGTTNQLLAGLALMTITLYLIMRAKPALYTLIPMGFVLLTTGWAMVRNLYAFAGGGEAERDTLLLCVASAVFLLEIGVLVTGGLAYLRFRRAGAARAESEPPAARDEAPPDTAPTEPASEGTKPDDPLASAASPEIEETLEGMGPMSFAEEPPERPAAEGGGATPGEDEGPADADGPPGESDDVSGPHRERRDEKGEEPSDPADRAPSA